MCIKYRSIYAQFIHAIKEEGLEKNMMVIFLADHEICVGTHGISGKQNMYDEAIRLPLIIYLPKIKDVIFASVKM